MLVQADARAIPLKDKSVGGVITSPPYNNSKKFPCDDWSEHASYIAFLRHCYDECRRVSRGPICWILPLLIRGHFLYAEVGDWQFATPIISGSEHLLSGAQFGRGWTRAYVGVEVLVCTDKPRTGAWIIFAPQPFIGPVERNRPRHPAPFVREVPGAAMMMFPAVESWLDPFGGTGTMAVAAKSRGVRYVTMDLKWDYVLIQQEELRQEALF